MIPIWAIFTIKLSFMAGMMQIEILAFGIAKDIVGGSRLPCEVDEGTDVEKLRDELFDRFPSLRNLASLAIAINSEYATDDQLIRPGDEVVLIPPVSGG